MPQMMPMNWVILPLSFLSLYLVLFSSLFFFSSVWAPTLVSTPTIKSINLSWSW